MKICKWSFNGHNFDSEQKLDEYLKSHFSKDLKTGVKFSKDIKEMLTEINKVASEKLKEDRAKALERHLNMPSLKDTLKRILLSCIQLRWLKRM